jgi:hypothetical protein
MPKKYNPKNKDEKLKLKENNKTKKKTGKVRFFFPRDMSPEEMTDAVLRIAKKYGINLVDDRKKHGIPIVDSRKKFNVKKLKP